MIVISHCVGNLTSTISHFFVMHALLNTNLPLVLQIGCLTARKHLSVGSGPNVAVRWPWNVLQCLLPRDNVEYPIT